MRLYLFEHCSLLRSAAVVKDLPFPRKVRDYFETMMSLIGYRPLPAV